MNPLEKITLDDLDDRSRELADVIGLDAFIRLVQYAGGSKLNIPTPNNATKKKRNAEIVREYNGYNVHWLAVKHGLTDDAVHKIIQKHKMEFARNQMSLL